MRPRWIRGKECDKSCAGKERYASLYLGCGHIERNGTGPFRSSYAKVKFLGTWIKRREVNGVRRIRNEKMQEHQYIERYAGCFQNKRVEWYEDRNIEQMWKP